MKRLIYGLAILVPICISEQVLAKTKPLTLSYSEVALKYEMFSTEATLNGSPQTLKGNGAYLALSYNAFKNIALNVEYGNGSADTTFQNAKWEIDIKQAVSIGANYHTPIYYDTDIVAGASLLRGKSALKVNGAASPEIDQNGYGINLGIRSLVGRRLELNGRIDQTEVENTSDTKFTVGGAYYLTKQVSAGLTYSVNDKSHYTVLSLAIYY